MNSRPSLVHSFAVWLISEGLVPDLPSPETHLTLTVGSQGKEVKVQILVSQQAEIKIGIHDPYHVVDKIDSAMLSIRAR